MANRKFPVYARVLAGAVAMMILFAALYRLFVSKELDFGTFAMIFGFLWLGFIAVTGMDAVDYVRKRPR